MICLFKIEKVTMVSTRKLLPLRRPHGSSMLIRTAWHQRCSREQRSANVGVWCLVAVFLCFIRGHAVPCRVLSCRDMSDTTSRLVMQIVTCDKIPATDARRPRENWNAKFFHGRPACTACQNSHGDGLECAFDIALDVRDRAHLRCFSTCRPTTALGCRSRRT